MFSRHIWTIREQFSPIDNIFPFPFRLDDPPSARALPPPQHVAAEGGRGRTGRIRKARCIFLDKKRVPIVIPVLDHLARDPGFDSRLIVSTIPMFQGEPLGDERSLKWVRDFSEQKWSSRIETHLAVFVEQNIAFRSSSLAPEELLEDLQKNEWPSPICAPMRPDRYRPGYFYKAHLEAVREARIEREQEFQREATPLSETKFLQRVRHIDRMVKKIRKNGGDAIFVRFPSAGSVRAMEQDSWPRQKYWDVLAERVDALFVHYEDYPALQGYRLPDESHLSFDEAVRFTRNLTRILIRKGFDTDGCRGKETKR